MPDQFRELDRFIMASFGPGQVRALSGTHTGQPARPLHICDHCHGTSQGRQNAMLISNQGFKLCQQCYQAMYFGCAMCGYVTHRYFMQEVAGGYFYCVGCYNSDMQRCAECTRMHTSRNLLHVTLPNRVGSSRLCNECYEAKYFNCRCGHTVNLSETIQFRKRRYCRACHDKKFIQAIDTVTTRYNKSKRMVGFEIEYFVPSRNRDKARDATAPYGRTKGDGSILPEDGCWGQEFASKITCGDSTIRTVRQVCTALRRLGGKVNDSCGLHIHLDVFDDSKEQRNNIIVYWQAFEHVFFALVSASRRTNTYCRPSRGEDMHYLENDRYRALNIAALSKFGTFEVRLHQGTLDREKIEYWIRLLLRFFDTFSHIAATSERIRGLNAMSQRHRMILLMRALGMKLSERKRILRRIRQCYGGNPSTSKVIFPKPKQRPLITPTVELS